MSISRLASTGSDNRPSGTQALTGRVDTFVSNLSDLFPAFGKGVHHAA